MSEIEQLRAENARLQAACAEMRDALIPWECETCNGTKEFTFECVSCLSGEGECSCREQKPEPCPQCQAIEAIKETYAKRDHALSLDAGKGWLSPEKVKQVRGCILEIKEWRDSAEKEYLESIDISHPEFYIDDALAALEEK